MEEEKSKVGGWKVAAGAVWSAVTGTSLVTLAGLSVLFSYLLWVSVALDLPTFVEHMRHALGY